jgi:hypothetical protein
MTARRVGLATLIGTLLAAGTAWAAFEPEPGSPYPTGSDPYAVYSADFNADGRPDLAVLNGTSSTIQFFLRQPTGGFAQEEVVPVSAGPSYAAVADYNGDGLPDLAVAGYVGQAINVLIRQPGGGFVAETTPAVSGRWGSIGAGDFNGDGRTDLVAGDFDRGGGTLLLRNAGNTGFTSAGAVALGPNPRQIEIADFNGDSLPDIAVTNSLAGNTGTVTVLLRSSPGSFVTEGSLPVGTGPQDLVAVDFNGDGRNDLAVANATTSNVSVYLRDAAGGFTQEAGSPIAVGAGPAGIASADFNRDGRPDLAVTGGDVVNVLLRNAAGGFTADAPISVPGSYGVAAGDFDGDARPDIAASSLSTSQLSIFRNPAPVQPPAPTPTPTATPTPVPPPVAGKSVNAQEKSGTVKVRLPGSSKFIDISGTTSLPTGTEVDTRKGRITLIAAGQGGTADFFDGLFKISQTKGVRPRTTLTLTEKLSCPKSKKSPRASAKKKKSRRLWGDGKGNFRTQGKYSAATIRGTKWLVTDRCDSTTTKVTQGLVTVRDNVRHKSVVVRKGHSYVARRKR